MRTLKTELNFDHIKENKPKLCEVWEGFLISGARTAFKDGVDLKMQIQLVKIIDKINKSNGTVELEDAEFEILDDISTRAKFDPAYSRIGSQVLSRIKDAEGK